jgi:hypothetical protein
VEEKKSEEKRERNPVEEQIKLGNQILDLLGQHTKNPGEAFMMYTGIKYLCLGPV